MRILHVITSLSTGGAERLMVGLLPLLRDKGNHHVDILLFNGYETPFKKELEEKGIKIFVLGKKDKLDDKDVYNPMHIFQLRKFMRGYDVIHTHNTACQFYVPLARILFGGKTKLVTTEHNSTNRRRQISWFKPIDRWMYRQYSSIICIARQTRINLEEYIGFNEAVTTIYNGVDINKFKNSINDISNKDSFIITMVAAFREQKDQDTLLKAMLLLPDSYHLRFIGSGERELQIKSLCDEMALEKRVSFLGVRSDIPAILGQSDIIVLSSHWEGLSLSSIEGMASGRPFIASDVDGLHEMVAGAGVLFPHGDEKELAKQIQYLCEHPDEYRAVAERCQERARQYDISVMADKYLELYQKLYQDN